MHENGTSRARAALRVLAVFAPLGVAAATLGLPRTAGAATSFCGSGVGVDRDQSVWQAVQAYKLATQAPSPNRNCLHCHNQSFGGIFEYSRSAFELDILGDWIKSSYWAPGYSKAWAAARLGQAGGRAATPAKQAAARANGRHGGRPRSAA